MTPNSVKEMDRLKFSPPDQMGSIFPHLQRPLTNKRNFIALVELCRFRSRSEHRARGGGSDKTVETSTFQMKNPSPFGCQYILDDRSLYWDWWYGFHNTLELKYKCSTRRFRRIQEPCNYRTAQPHKVTVNGLFCNMVYWGMCCASFINDCWSRWQVISNCATMDKHRIWFITDLH